MPEVVARAVAWTDLDGGALLRSRGREKLELLVRVSPEKTPATRANGAMASKLRVGRGQATDERKCNNGQRHKTSPQQLNRHPFTASMCQVAAPLNHQPLKHKGTPLLVNSASL